MTSLPNPIVYTFRVFDKRIQNIVSPIGKSHFEKPVTQRGDKLYFILAKREIVYVGITTQPIRKRLRMGEKPNKKTGYHGYKWLETNGEYKIVIFMSNGLFELEAVEAEVVYNIRKHENRWPRHQTEIHFHNADDKQRQIAEAIYRKTVEIINE